MSEEKAHVIRGTVILVLSIGTFLWLLIRAVKRSEEPDILIFKWVLTIPLIWVIFRKLLPMGAEGGYAAIGAVMYGLLIGLALAIIWRRSIANMIAKPFGDLFDGGDKQIEPRPYYSVAQGKRKRGNYRGAIADIHRQLEMFPNDFEGQILLADIYAENLNDLGTAELGIHRVCAQEGHAPRSLAYAYNLLADWHLKFSQDRDAARQALQRIIERLPGSELAVLATQRIAHLADTDHLIAYYDRKPIALNAGVDGVGLLPSAQQPKAPEADVARQTTDYVKHLEEHPLDTDAREKLALLYANHYRRLDLAANQLEQMIAYPNQPAKRVVHWLNLLADLQVRHDANYETVRQTVQRIVDLFPQTPAAELALNRLNLLKLELKGQVKGPTVKMGSYEQDIGLKRGLPNKL